MPWLGRHYTSLDDSHWGFVEERREEKWEREERGEKKIGEERINKEWEEVR